jgi:hypothetical protein
MIINLSAKRTLTNPQVIDGDLKACITEFLIAPFLIYDVLGVEEP